MNTRTLATLGTIALLLFTAGPVAAQVDFSRYYVIGDSLAAGVVSNALVETHQRTSVPALIATQAAAPDFQQPLVGEPGIPPQLYLSSLRPRVVIEPKSATAGAPKNLGLTRSYNNMAVPGATAVDAYSTTTGGAHDLILRDHGTQLAQVVASRPTFVTLWIGNNDVLGAAIYGRAIDGVTLTPVAAFRQVYGAIIQTLKATGARIVAANLPDPTVIPFVTTIKPYVVDSAGKPVQINGRSVALLGPAGPLPPTDTYVTLAASSLLAQGIGIPKELGGTGDPLPDGVILDAGEVSIIRDHVDQNNQSIKQICDAAGVPVLDVHSILETVSKAGRDIGGVHLSAAFLTGGIFSYDGVHPSPLGYAIMANEWITVINQNGGSLRPINLAPFLGLGASASQEPPPTPPFEFTWEAYQELRTLFPLQGAQN